MRGCVVRCHAGGEIRERRDLVQEDRIPEDGGSEFQVTVRDRAGRIVCGY
jgi:hypothetical protein